MRYVRFSKTAAAAARPLAQKQPHSNTHTIRAVGKGDLKRCVIGHPSSLPTLIHQPVRKDAHHFTSHRVCALCASSRQRASERAREQRAQRFDAKNAARTAERRGGMRRMLNRNSSPMRILRTVSGALTFRSRAHSLRRGGVKPHRTAGK